LFLQKSTHGCFAVYAKPQKSLIKETLKKVKALQKNLTFKQYKAIDLSLFAIILVVLEGIIVTLSNTLINVNFTVTITYLIISLVIIRWGAWGAIHCVLSGFTFAIASKGDIGQIISFAAGNLFALTSLIYLKLIGKEKVRNSFALSSLFVVVIYLMTAIGRGAMLAVIKQANFFGLVSATLTTDILSLIVTLIITLFIRKQDGLFEDQKAYLIRTQKERENSLRGGDGED